MPTLQISKYPDKLTPSAGQRLALAVWISVSMLMLGCGNTVEERVVQCNREGVAFLVQQDYAAAEAQFRQAQALAPDDLTTLYNLAVLAHTRGQWDEAEKGYRRCLLQEPHFLAARRGLALLLWQQDRKTELQQLVTQWVHERPHLADAHALQGWYWIKMGDYPAAEASLKQALALDPQNPFALAELGRLYEIYRYPERARSLYERSLHYDPWQPELRARLTRLRQHRPGSGN